MRRSSRFAVLACAVALALATVALAAASYSPSMGIFQTTYERGGAGAVTVVVAQEKANDPTAKITIYVGLGYTTTLGQPPGTTIGYVIAHVEALDLSTNSLPLAGPVKTANPASYVSNPCVPGLHEAVWILNAALPGQPANPIPVYVDHTAGTDAAIGSAKLQVCFAPPDVPPKTPGRAPLGAKFLDAAFTVNGIFKNRSTSGYELWRSLFTPYTPGTGKPNLAGTTEAQAIVPTPYTVSVRRLRARRGFFRLAGKLNLAGSAPNGVRLNLFAGVKKKGVVSFSSVSVTKTHRGLYAFTRRLPAKTTYFFVERTPTSQSCATPTIVASCTTAITSNAISRELTIAPAKKRRR